MRARGAWSALRSRVKAAPAITVRHDLRRIASEGGPPATGAVSQQVKALQAGLGVELFEKRGRQLVLTASGRALQKSVASALASAWRSATRRFHSATSTKAGWCVRRRSRWRQCTTTTWSAPRRSGNARRSGRSSSGCCRLVSSAQPGSAVAWVSLQKAAWAQASVAVTAPIRELDVGQDADVLLHLTAGRGALQCTISVARQFCSTKVLRISWTDF